MFDSNTPLASRAGWQFRLRNWKQPYTPVSYDPQKRIIVPGGPITLEQVKPSSKVLTLYLESIKETVTLTEDTKILCVTEPGPTNLEPSTLSFETVRNVIDNDLPVVHTGQTKTQTGRMAGQHVIATMPTEEELEEGEVFVPLSINPNYSVSTTGRVISVATKLYKEIKTVHALCHPATRANIGFRNGDSADAIAAIILGHFRPAFDNESTAYRAPELGERFRPEGMVYLNKYTASFFGVEFRNTNKTGMHHIALVRKKGVKVQAERYRVRIYLNNHNVFEFRETYPTPEEAGREADQEIIARKLHEPLYLKPLNFPNEIEGYQGLNAEVLSQRQHQRVWITRIKSSIPMPANGIIKVISPKHEATIIGHLIVKTGD